ncbi:hypothetical protein B0H12DRAFT_1242304 [Mycena haematopus]|nr:hypothetical protein B0H12DRAFT_1242304 [Mycena haematopus]
MHDAPLHTPDPSRSWPEHPSCTRSALMRFRISSRVRLGIRAAILDREFRVFFVPSSWTLASKISVRVSFLSFLVVVLSPSFFSTRLPNSPFSLSGAYDTDIIPSSPEGFPLWYKACLFFPSPSRIAGARHRTDSGVRRRLNYRKAVVSRSRRPSVTRLSRLRFLNTIPDPSSPPLSRIGAHPLDRCPRCRTPASAAHLDPLLTSLHHRPHYTETEVPFLLPLFRSYLPWAYRDCLQEPISRWATRREAGVQPDCDASPPILEERISTVPGKTVKREKGEIFYQKSPADEREVPVLRDNPPIGCNTFVPASCQHDYECVAEADHRG